MSSTPLADQPRPTTSLPSSYVPADVEGPLYERWVDRGYFTADADERQAAVLASSSRRRTSPAACTWATPSSTRSWTPSPAASACRATRRSGCPAWTTPASRPRTWSSASSPREGKSRHDLGREEFVERVWEWKAEYGGRILGQMRRLGDGVDWTPRALHHGRGPVPRRPDDLQAALRRRPDLPRRAHHQLVPALPDGALGHRGRPPRRRRRARLDPLRRGRRDASSSPPPAPRRCWATPPSPCTPTTSATRTWSAREIELPLTGRRDPVRRRRARRPGVRHRRGEGHARRTTRTTSRSAGGTTCPRSTIMDERGVITAHGPFEGLDRFEARPAVVAALREEGRIVAEKRPYVHSVGHCSRCDTVVEPRLSLQWFVKVEPLAKAAGDAVRDGRVDDPPAGDGAALLRLGRQHARLVHLAPAVVGPPHPGLVRPGRRGRLRRPGRRAADRRGLDARTPTSSTPGSRPACGRSRRSAGRTRPPTCAKFYPTAVLLTGYDIIFFWVARMMMFGLYAMDGVRRRSSTVALHRPGARRATARRCASPRATASTRWTGWTRTAPTPLRFTLARGANPGADVADRRGVGRRAARNFCNKLWNATRFALHQRRDRRAARCPPASSCPPPTAGSCPG